MNVAFKELVKELDPTISVTYAEIRDIMRCGSKRRCSLLAGFDLVVLGGGGLYMPFFPWHRLTWLLDIDQPLILYAIGFNQHIGRCRQHTDEQLKAIRSINEKAALSSVRDDLSKDFLEKLGVSHARIICDPAAAYLPQRTRSKKSQLPRVGINIPAHGIFNQAKVHQSVLPILTRFLENLSNRNYELHYMIHDSRESRVVKSLAALPLKVHKHRPAQLALAYTGLDLNIGGMLHSSIFAFSAGIPFLCLAYDEKQPAFLRLTNSKLRQLSLYTLSLEKLSESFEKIENDREAISIQMQKTKNELRATHLDFLQAALDMIV